MLHDYNGIMNMCTCINFIGLVSAKFSILQRPTVKPGLDGGCGSYTVHVSHTCGSSSPKAAKKKPSMYGTNVYKQK